MTRFLLFFNFIQIDTKTYFNLFIEFYPKDITKISFNDKGLLYDNVLILPLNINYTPLNEYPTKK